MDEPGNLRPARSSPIRKRTEDQSEKICLQDLNKLRDDMKTAYEQYVTQKTETVCQPQTVVDELKFYACQLIGHLRATGKKEELQCVISDIVNELREEAETVWDPLFSIDDKQSMDSTVEVQQLKDCLVEIKRQKQILEEKVEQLINKSYVLTEELNSGMMKSSTANSQRQRKKEKRKLSEKLQDLVHLHDTNARISEDEIRKTTDEICKLKERISEIWGHVSNEMPPGVDTQIKRPFTPVEMLSGIEASFDNCQQNMDRNNDMQNKIEDLKEKFIGIWRLFSDETEANQQGTSKNAGKNPNIEEMNDCIVFNIKKLQWKREKFVNQVACLLKGIWMMIRNEPFNFSIPTNLDNDNIVKGVHSYLRPTIISINCLHESLKENSERLRKKIIVGEEYNKIKENEEGLLREIKKLKEEKDELLNRLSKFAGANLTENNPAIADLSDPNRATKLAEQYSELYDNTWTDAFEVLETSDERRRVDFLLEILVESYEVCGKISQNQLEIFIKGIFSPSDGMTRVNVTEQKQKEDRKLLHSKVQLKALTELRKLSTETAVRDVKLHIEAEHTEWVTRKELEEYTTQCIKLCWFMHVQSPPVYLDAYVEPGSTFHTNKHRQYTKSGTKLDYLVWPTLLLHEGGPVLCKGVAQGK